MAAYYLQCFWGLSLLLCLCFSQSISTSHVYIVYLGGKTYGDPFVSEKSHVKLLSNVFGSEQEAKDSMLYSYKYSFSGFSAKLNSSQAVALSNIKGVISVFRSNVQKLHTTRSWDFVGLTLDDSEGAPPQLTYGGNIVIGVFDTGVWPESESFKRDHDLGPIPSKWRGECVGGQSFEPKTACNRKLIGARYYLKGFEEEYGPLNKTGSPEYRSPRDYSGHGSHTASTAAGSIAKHSSYLGGIARGTARGGAPKARLAVYKICWTADGICSDADTLSAFDDALRDGVHVISCSFGSPPPLQPFFMSTAGIGSFHAMQLGVSVVFSGGNDGPDPAMVTNVFPWAVTVAASSIDRSFPTQLVVDANFSVTGEGFVTKGIQGSLAAARTYFADGICKKENWNNKTATNMVILCFSAIGPVRSSLEAAVAVKTANGAGLIFVQAPTLVTPDLDVVPTIHLDIGQGSELLLYLTQSLTVPHVVQIFPSRTTIGKEPAPVVASFSSRGPSSLSPDILKPDITAPGVNILAAWPSKTPPTLLPIDDRVVNWNFQSGTSMSCPHVSGVVALLKSAHPDWSPAAIKSALMTTAYTRDTTYDSILVGGTAEVSGPFEIGAGHIDPVKAIDPGLIYDMKISDYIVFLCNLGYTQEEINMLVQPCPPPWTDTSCKRAKTITNANLNYPSITVSNLQSSTTIKRTVRNVGRNKNAIYFATRVVKPNGVELVIWPQVLIFSHYRQEISYHVTLIPLKKSQGRYDFGEIVWSDGIHNVRSPLVVLVNTTTAANRRAFTHIISSI